MPHRLRHHLAAWRRITSDKDVLAIVQHGLRFELASTPDVARRGPTFRGSAEQKRHLAATLAEWLQRGIIEPEMSRDALVSLLFPVRKAGAQLDWRWVLDSRRLNAHLRATTFKMDGINQLRWMLRRGDWLASVDLSSAFLHVPIARRHRRLLAFTALGRQYRFAVMSFGTSVAPSVFTLVLKPALAALHRLGIRVSAYLDDLLIAAPTQAECWAATQRVLDLLNRLGFLINGDKSVIEARQQLDHLGFRIDTRRWRLLLPPAKVAALRKEARRVLRWSDEGALTARRLAGLIGKMTAAMPASRAVAMRRHSLNRNLQYMLRRGNGSWETTAALSRTARRDATWLTTLALKMHNGEPLTPPPPDAVLTTDASPTGWGATLSIGGQCITTHGFFGVTARAASSNWRESTAITLAYFAFRRRLRRVRTLLVRTDNTTALSTLRRLGSRHRHLGLALEPLLRACFRRRTLLQAEHIAGLDNTAADRLSRLDPSRNEWRLAPTAYRSIVAQFGEPTIDWFATHRNALCRRFASRRPDPRATFVDAMRATWSGQFGLFVPPINLLHKVVARLDEQQATGIVVVPNWPTRPWFGSLMQLARATLPLPRGSMLVESGFRHPMRDQRAPPLIAVLL
jgi:hypothetical protein